MSHPHTWRRGVHTKQDYFEAHQNTSQAKQEKKKTINHWKKKRKKSIRSEQKSEISTLGKASLAYTRKETPHEPKERWGSTICKLGMVRKDKGW